MFSRMILGPLNILTSLCHGTSLDGVFDTAEVLIKSLKKNTGASVHVNGQLLERSFFASNRTSALADEYILTIIISS